MKAVDIENHFFSVADWVSRDKTVDGILLGDPQKEIKTVLVTWMPGFGVLRAAVAGNFDMLMPHEPTFYANVERGKFEETELGIAKKKFIEESGLVLLRNHDVWDRMPEIGIPWAWARFLELGDQPAAVGANGYLHRYDIEPVTLDQLALRIAARTSTIGQPAVQVAGDPSRPVSKVGIGTGCACNISKYIEMGCDVSVVCDDGSIYWKTIQWAKDSDHPVIRVNHGTSEEPGMVTLTKYVNDTFPGVAAEHLPHGCCYRLVAADN